MKQYILLCLLFISLFSKAQKLKPGFDKWECMEMLRIAQLQALPPSKWNDKRAVPQPEKFSFVYRSPLVGLQNMWDLWVSKDSIAVISIRGTDIEPNPVSWMVNLYAAMVPAKGELKLEHDFQFKYNLCDDPKAAVHVGFLVATAYLSRDIVPKIEAFIDKIQQQHPQIIIERLDERFTSKMAFQSMIDSGMKKKDRRNKALVDEISATILLQNYLEYKN